MNQRRAVAGIAGVMIVLIVPAACRRAPDFRLPEWQKEVGVPAAQWLQKPAVRLLRDYVRIDTTDPPGRERRGAEFLKEYLDCEGVPSQLICPDADRCNLYARLPGRRSGRALLLLNHIDVVPIYRRGWTKPPFGGAIEKSYMYGRGVYDMKSIGIAQLLAFVDLAHSGMIPDRDVVFLAECGEEFGGTDGVSWLFEHRPDVLAGVDCVLNEGGYEEMVAGSLRYWGIEVAQGGMGYAVLCADDRAAFGPATGFEDLGLFVPPEPAVKAFFEATADYRAPFFANAFRHPDLLKLAEIRKWIPYQNLSLVRGGIFRFPPYEAKLIPEFDFGSRWNASLAVSVPLGVDPHPYLDRAIGEARKKGARLAYSECTPAGTASPFQTPEIAAIRRVLDAVQPGTPVVPIVNSFSETTSVEFRKRGITAYGFDPIQIDPIDAARRHGNDERIFLPFFTRGIETMKQVLFEMVAQE